MSSPFNVVSNQKIMQIRPFEAADGTLTIWGSQWVFKGPVAELRNASQKVHQEVNREWGIDNSDS